ncbi:MAG TPA: hypothetical protein VGL22_19595 [Terracidiphilus sp.]
MFPFKRSSLLLVPPVLYCAALFCATLFFPEDATTEQQAGTSNPRDRVAIEMANVLFRYSPELAVSIVRLQGELLPAPGHAVVSFNDPASFLVATDAAEMRMNMAQLSALMNSWLLRSPKAQLKNVRIAAEDGRLQIHGTMKKGLHIPFSSTATVSISNDNRIRIAVEKVKAADLPLKGFMDALGMSLDDLISQKGLQGLSVDKDAFLIDPQTAFPPPQIRARIAGVNIVGQNLVLTFGRGAPQLKPRPWKNYMAMRGGSMQYGREQMFDSDLTMIDSTPADPFEFYLHDYWCQMVAGSIKAQPDKSMRVYVPDYSKMPKGACRR